jgi:hypothetical protein
MVMNMSLAQPLTHKVITGFSNVVEIMPDGQKSYESENGLMVIEMAPPHGRKVWVRHGVTTNADDLLHREWNIVGQQDAMVYMLRAYLNDANLIGQPIYDYTLINVKSSAEAALQSLKVNSIIDNYAGLEVRQLITDPDVIEIGFSWRPAFGLNYIVLTFGISLLTGDSATQGASPNISDFSSTNVNGIQAPSQSAINDFGGSSNTLRST